MIIWGYYLLRNLLHYGNYTLSINTEIIGEVPKDVILYLVFLNLVSNFHISDLKDLL